MAKVKVSGYIKQIEKEYKKARERYEETTRKIEKIEKDYKNIDSKMYSVAGMERKQAEYIKTLNETKRQYDGIRDDFIKECERITIESDKVFTRRFGYTPQDIDANGITILEKGNLPPNDIVRIAEDYKEQGNYTMFYMFAEHLKESSDTNIKAWYNNAVYEKNTRPDRENITAFVDCCLAGLRDDTALANGIHRKHEGFLQAHINAGEQIEIDIQNPWEK